MHIFFPEFVGGETDDDYHEEVAEKLYDGHIPTNLFQKSILAVGSAVAGLADPWRADMVAVNGEVLGENFDFHRKIASGLLIPILRKTKAK
jgi:hypothetical protein